MSKIMAVDDARVIRDLVKVTLERSGHEVVTFENGALALAWARDNEVDLVITDHHMPGIKGTELVGELRNIQHLKGIPIVMLTTETKDDVKSMAKRSGASAWVIKPITPEALMEGVQRLLGK